MISETTVNMHTTTVLDKMKTACSNNNTSNSTMKSSSSSSSTSSTIHCPKYWVPSASLHAQDGGGPR